MYPSLYKDLSTSEPSMSKHRKTFTYILSKGISKPHETLSTSKIVRQKKEHSTPSMSKFSTYEPLKTLSNSNSCSFRPHETSFTSTTAISKPREFFGPSNI